MEDSPVPYWGDGVGCRFHLGGDMRSILWASVLACSLVACAGDDDTDVPAETDEDTDAVDTDGAAMTEEEFYEAVVLAACTANQGCENPAFETVEDCVPVVAAQASAAFAECTYVAEFADDCLAEANALECFDLGNPELPESCNQAIDCPEDTDGEDAPQ